MPEGTEMPAPVSATVALDSRISSAKRWMLIELGSRQLAVRYCELLTANCSLALELRLALLDERADALARVLRAERRREALLLGCDALVEVALVRDRLDLLDRDRRLARRACAPSSAPCRAARGPGRRRGRARGGRPPRPRIASPVRFISSAFASPTRRGRRCVPPNPGMIPRLISGWPNVADSAASRKSQAMDSSQPPPNAMLLTAAIVVVLECSISRSIAWPPSSSPAPAGRVHLRELLDVGAGREGEDVGRRDHH